MSVSALLEDLNAMYFATAKQLIIEDKATAKLKLGLDDEMIEVIMHMTQSEIIAICKTEVPQYKLFVSAKNLANSAKSLRTNSQKAWMFLSRANIHAVA